MILLIDHKPAAIKEGSSFDYTSDNRLFADRDDYTMSIELPLDCKENVDENTVWTGYFWMDEWSTMEIAKTSFDGVNWSDYKAIRFYSEAGRTDYIINVLTRWDEGGKLGDQTTMTMTNEYAELSLEGIDMATRLDTDRLMVQCNKESGFPFNFTAIVLVKKESTGIAQVSSQQTAGSGHYFNLAGQRVAQPTKGLYIINGKKIVVR